MSRRYGFTDDRVLVLRGMHHFGLSSDDLVSDGNPFTFDKALPPRKFGFPDFLSILAHLVSDGNPFAIHKAFPLH